jgi:uncharacterized membrane protein
MTAWLAGYASAAVVFLVLDIIWLSQVTEKIYQPALGSLLADQVFLPAAIAFYLIYVAGIMVLAVQPGLRAQSLLTAILTGAMLGLVAYGTYDLTNLATLKGWPLHVALLDLAWGTVVTAIASGAAYLAMRAFPTAD